MFGLRGPARMSVCVCVCVACACVGEALFINIIKRLMTDKLERAVSETGLLRRDGDSSKTLIDSKDLIFIGILISMLAQRLLVLCSM